MNIEYDIKEILTRIEARFDKLDGRFDKLEAKVDKVAEDVGSLKTNLARVEAELKGEIVRVEAELKGEVKVLGEKMGDMNKRLDREEFINRGVVIGLVLAVLGGFAKVFGLVN